MRYEICYILVTLIVNNGFAVKNISRYYASHTADKSCECVLKYVERFQIRYVLLVSETENEIQGLWKPTSTITKITFQNDFKLLSRIKFIEAFVIFLKTVQQFEEWLTYARSYKFWNPRGQFIVVIKSHENITQLFNISWKFYVININVIVLNEIVPNIYTYFPYNSNNCTINYKPVSILSCNETIPNDVYPNKIPQSLKFCEIQMVTIIIPPYVINTSEPNRDDPKLVGTEITIMRTLAKKINFTEKYLKHSSVSWGYKLPNGTYTDMYKILKDNQADVMFGMAPSEFPEDFDISPTHLFEYSTWWVPTANLEPSWRNIVRIFHQTVWILIITALIFNIIFCKIFSTSKHMSVYFIIFWSSLLQCAVKSPKLTVIRIVFIFWVFFSLLLSTCYQSKLISMLTKPTYEHQISNLAEILESKLSFGFFPKVIPTFFNDPEDKVQKFLADTYIKCPLSEECVNRTAFKRDFAVVKSYRHVMYYMKKYYLDANGKPLLYGCKDGMLYMPKYLVRKGFPLLDDMSRLLLLLHASGLVEKWDRDTLYSKDIKDERYLKPLSINNLCGPFICLIIGLTTGLFVFFVEIFVEIVK